jgi:WD repeat-containing protein 48
MDGVGAVVAAGSTDAIVRVWDARDPSGCAKPAFKLKGHSDNVRSIAIDPSGRMCLTASSDRTLRLWDLGQRRCVQSLPGVHACAAWAARPADDSWHRAYSGGSDGRVYVTDLAHRRSSLLFQEKHGVLDLRVDARSGGKHVWAATMGTEVNKYRVDVTSGEHDAFGVAGSIGSNGSIGGRRRQSGGLIDRMSIDGGSHSHSHHHHGESGASMSMGGGSSPHGALWFSAGRSPRKSGGANPFASPSSSPFAASSAASARAAASHALPSVTIRGAAPIVQHAQLNDRVRVLAKDANGEVTLWDVTKCALVRTFAPGSVFEDVLAAINPIVAIPSWFTVDSRSGSLAITLSPSGAFAAEAYAQEMGVPGAIAETKINVGVQTIHALLRDWAARRAARADDENDTRTAFYGYSAAHASDDHDPSKLDPCDDAGAFATPDPPPVLLCEHHGGASWVRVPVEGLRGGDDEEALMPEWIVDCASGRHPVPESAKASFFVNPDPDVETPLPCIQNARVTAPRVLQSRKVSAYVLQKLRVEAPGGARPEDCLSLTCNGAECDPNMSMATIAKFMWKRGDEVQLLYSWREGVPMPDGLGGDGLASG